MIPSFISRCFGAVLAATALAVTPQLVGAGPGAHGPNGEHLDAAHTAPAGAGQAGPRIEAKSDLFELVGTLAGGELSIFIDRFDTNEPVLKAQVEVESGGLKAQAKFHEDVGDYSIEDPAMLKKLSEPGEHPLVITVIEGKDSDLLDAVLRVQALPADHGHGHGIHWEWWGLGSLAVVALLGIATTRLRGQRQRSFMQGGRP